MTFANAEVSAKVSMNNKRSVQGGQQWRGYSS